MRVVVKSQRREDEESLENNGVVTPVSLWDSGVQKHNFLRCSRLFSFLFLSSWSNCHTSKLSCPKTFTERLRGPGESKRRLKDRRGLSPPPVVSPTGQLS